MRRLALASVVAALVETPPAVAQAAQPGRVLHAVRDIPSAIRRCWTVPQAARRFERIEATVRFSLRADGSLNGATRVAFVATPLDVALRELVARSVRAAIEACTPLPLGPGLGRAVAGRVFAVRFIYSGKPGQGV